MFFVLFVSKSKLANSIFYSRINITLFRSNSVKLARANEHMSWVNRLQIWWGGHTMHHCAQRLGPAGVTTASNIVHNFWCNMSRNLAHAIFFATKTNMASVATKQKAAAIIVLLLLNENKQINKQTNKQTNKPEIVVFGWRSGLQKRVHSGGFVKVYEGFFFLSRPRHSWFFFFLFLFFLFFFLDFSIRVIDWVLMKQLLY